MKKIFFDKLSLTLLLFVCVSFFIQRDVFYGLVLFFINFITFKILVNSMFQFSSDNNSMIKKYLFIPVMFLKMFAIGGISYFVLVYLDGNPYFYVGGFGMGLVIFTIGMSVSHFFKRSKIVIEK